MSKKIVAVLLLVVLIAAGIWVWRSHVHAPATAPRAAVVASPGAAATVAPQDPVFVAGSAFDACKTPAEPTAPPSGASATRAQMLVSQQSAKAFDTATNVYLACVDQAASAFNQQYGRYLSAATLRQIEALHTRLHNGAVDVDEAVATRFNRELRIFRARSGAS